MCSYTDMWADMAICHSTPLGLHHSIPRCSQLGINIVRGVMFSDVK